MIIWLSRFSKKRTHLLTSFFLKLTPNNYINYPANNIAKV